MKVLFITWDGPRSRYLESIFLPIFSKLRSRGISFYVMQFTWGGPAHVERQRKICEAAGVPYRAVQVWRYPSIGAGSFLSALRGSELVIEASRAWGVDVLMPRSLMPALATLAATSRLRLPIVFDADGLNADERVDFAGLSTSSMTYRVLRYVEAEIVRRCSSVIVRSAAAGAILAHRAGAGFEAERIVITLNGCDLRRFPPVPTSVRSDARDLLGFGRADPVVCYSGSFGAKYNFERMGKLFALVRRKADNAKLLLLCPEPEDAMKAVLPALGGHQGGIVALEVDPAEIGWYLAAADVGLALISNAFSMKGATPTKVGEYLLAGLPVIGTTGVGDVGEIFENDFAFSVDTDDRLNDAAEWVVTRVMPNREEYRRKARAYAETVFSLEATAANFARALECTR